MNDQPKKPDLLRPEAMLGHVLAASLLQIAQRKGASQIFILLVMPDGQVAGELRGDPEQASESFGKLLARSFGGATLRCAVQRFADAVSGHIRGGVAEVFDEERPN